MRYTLYRGDEEISRSFSIVYLKRVARGVHLHNPNLNNFSILNSAGDVITVLACLQLSITGVRLKWR